MNKKQAINTLHQIKRTAQEASLTGSLLGGGGLLVETYNSIREKAISEKWLEDDGIIPAVDKNGGNVMDTVGCAAALLIGILSE